MLSTSPSRGPCRYRVCVTRMGAARHLTHLGQIEALRRAVSSSGLPIALADARRKKPRPRLSFGPAISLGYESAAEYFDLELTLPCPAEQVRDALTRGLPDGFSVRDARRIPKFFPSLDESINVARYEVRGPFPEGSARSLESFLARERIVIEKVKKGGAVVERIDAKPLILEMGLSDPECLRLTLRFGPKRTVKPEALIREWLSRPAAPGDGFRIVRTELLTETSGGELLKP